jgi:hypothetical protein
MACNQDLLERGGRKFMGYILFACCNLSQKCLLQQFYVTFLAKFHGLSRKGMDSLAAYGYLSKRTFFNSEMDDQKLRSKHEVIRYRV